MGKIKLEGYICERCSHKWISRSNRKTKNPVVCPRCKSPYWNIPRKNLKKVKTKLNKRGKKNG